ncbi:MAG: hypothetical protein K6T16_01870 [Candidatus Pacearchaeota archaeon]|nr:hypothetical protein [Candidatus Pacearchaeota archaeon]
MKRKISKMKIEHKLEIYINLVNLPEVVLTPIISKKRYAPPTYNCDSGEDRKQLIRAIQNFYETGKYKINYVLSSSQIDKIVKRDLIGVSLLEFLLDDLDKKKLR